MSFYFICVCACVCVCVFDITVCMSMCVVKGHWPIPVRRMIHGIRGPLAGGGGGGSQCHTSILRNNTIALSNLTVMLRNDHFILSNL